MRYIKWVFVVLLIVPFYSRGDDEYFFYLGRLTKACLHEEAGHPFGKTGPVKYGDDEAEIFKQINEKGIWNRFSYGQKREFALVALLDCDLDGDSAEEFQALVKEDSVRLAGDLKQVPISYLREFRHLDQRGINNFKTQADLLVSTKPRIQLLRPNKKTPYK